MEEIDYQSPAPRGPLPPEAWEDAYGCFPAVLSVVLGVGGAVMAAMARAGGRPLMVGGLIVALALLAAAWRSAVAAVQSRRGRGFGIVAVAAVATLTAAAAGAALFVGR